MPSELTACCSRGRPFVSREVAADDVDLTAFKASMKDFGALAFERFTVTCAAGHVSEVVAYEYDVARGYRFRLAHDL